MPPQNPLEGLFTKQAAAYAKYRPHYPKALFEFLASVAPSRRRAWDCATGNGQAAVDLAEYFDEVTATDVSEAQIQNALPHPKVRYSVAPAEKTSLESQAFDLITVAQAAHWLNHDLFYGEVRRVLKPGGVVALWCYGHNREVAAPLEAVYRKFTELTKPFWPPQVHYIWEEYKTLPFPFEEIPAPSLSMEAQWDLDSFIGYHWSWSATQKYLEKKGVNPLELIARELREAWGPPETHHKVAWRIYLRVGRI